MNKMESKLVTANPWESTLNSRNEINKMCTMIRVLRHTKLVHQTPKWLPTVSKACYEPVRCIQWMIIKYENKIMVVRWKLQKMIRKEEKRARAWLTYSAQNKAIIILARYRAVAYIRTGSSIIETWRFGPIKNAVLQ